MNPANVAAGLLVLAEAGGITTDWKGQDLHFRAGTDTINLAASNGWVSLDELRAHVICPQHHHVLGDQMTENDPPVPPEPQPSNQPFAAPGQPPNQPPRYHQAPPAPYGQQPHPPQSYVQPQPYPAQGYGQPAYAQTYPQNAPYPYQAQPGWTAPLPPKSSIRTAAGVMTIVMGAWMLVTAVAGFGFGLLLLGLTALTAGILVLALRRSKGVQIFALVCSGVAVLAALLSFTTVGVIAPLMLLSLAAPATVLTSMSVAKERRGA